MSFHYAKLGNNCESQTLGALTSNAKYISPLSNVYLNVQSPTIFYSESDINSFQREQLPKIIHKSCTSCKR